MVTGGLTLLHGGFLCGSSFLVIDESSATDSASASLFCDRQWSKKSVLDEDGEVQQYDIQSDREDLAKRPEQQDPTPLLRGL